jgi:hypothetical protein
VLVPSVRVVDEETAEIVRELQRELGDNLTSEQLAWLRHLLERAFFRVARESGQGPDW